MTGNKRKRFVPKAMDFNEVELRVIAHHLEHGGKIDEPYGPTDRAERGRWKARNFGKHYGSTKKGSGL